MKTKNSNQIKKCGVSTIITDKNKMKRQLQKKFYAFIFTAMMFSASANAQIVYTDLNPDSTMYCNAPVNPCNKNYNLDLNNDANNDFIIGSHA